MFQICLYECRDPILKKWWWKRYDDIVDIGAFGRWLLLERNFDDYDVNEEEFGKAIV